MIKIKLHSITDLITNSSTVIFTYSEGCVEPLKEMINEIINVINDRPFNIGRSLTCDDMFDTVILCYDSTVYGDYIARMDEGDYPEGVDKNTDIKKLWEDVTKGKTPKPEWFNLVEDEDSQSEGFRPTNYLYLIPKEEKYIKMGKLIKDFLYSTQLEATENG